MRRVPVSVAIIPARGGSKRIPRKNIRPFAGKPIIAYSIRAAVASELFDRVLVSTEDPEIAETARRWGAETPFVRPSTLADDHTGTDAVVNHAIGWLADAGFAVGYACCIYATAPFLQTRYLREGYERLLASGKDFAFSLTPFDFPAQWALRITRDGFVEAVNPEKIFMRSQELEPLFHDAAQFYWGRAEAYLKGVAPHSGASVPVIVPRHLVQDIDTPQDWRRAELMYEVLRMAGEISA
jgi:N-acylneuraminate cytidylyltransferase